MYKYMEQCIGARSRDFFDLEQDQSPGKRFKKTKGKKEL
jgi:hypothetical protein